MLRLVTTHNEARRFVKERDRDRHRSVVGEDAARNLPLDSAPGSLGCGARLVSAASALPER